MRARGSKRRAASTVRVFRSLLLLSLLEGILWSLCLFHSASALGLAYYDRETANLKSTTASLPFRPPPPALNTRALFLALREESRARQRTLETHVRALPALRDQPVALSSQAFRQTFGEFRHDSGAAEKPAGATF